MIKKCLIVFLLTVLSVSLHSESLDSTHTSQPLGYVAYLLEAEWCGACKILNGVLEANNADKEISLNINGQSQLVEIVRVDMDSVTDEDFRSFGFERKIVPQVSMALDGVPLGSTLIRSKAIESMELSELNPKVGENYHSYKGRLNNTLESVGFLAYKKVFEHLAGPDRDEPIRYRRPVHFNPEKGKPGVVLWGTGERVFDNPIFSGKVMRRVKTILSSIGVPEKQVLTLYGAGDSSGKIPDTAVEEAGVKKLVAIEGLDANASLTRLNLQQGLEKLNESETKNALLISVGHGYEDGFPTWFESESLDPDYMSSIIPSQLNNTVMISGNCYGGIFAEVPRCGFFSARPNLVSSGCQEEDLEDYGDYVSHFFEAIQAEESSDKNNDGKISFSEAHWYAVENGDSRDVPYTSFDSLVDRFFMSLIPDTGSPEFVSSEEIVNDLFNIATLSEKALLTKYLEKNKDQKLFYLRQAFIPATVHGIPVEFSYDPMEFVEDNNVRFFQSGPNIGKTLPNFFLPVFARKNYEESGNDLDEATSYFSLGLYPTMTLDGEELVYGLNFQMGKFSTNVNGDSLEDLGVVFENYFPGKPKDLLVLTQILRRLYFRKHLALSGDGFEGNRAFYVPKVKELLACENQSIREFLK